ncbi:unnamed protein product, partial [Soboliphyme baturini]|uniref:ERCC4 domain-containing protein n=1 Tax=Soboliphyme baturini TaxID=241478 RepID=A0A183IRR3_9BILA
VLGPSLKKEDDLLTDAQLTEYFEKFYTAESVFTLITHRPLLCLQIDPFISKGDLSTYYLWQARDIPWFFSGHSCSYDDFMKLSKRCAYLSKVPEELHDVIEDDFISDDNRLEEDVRMSLHRKRSNCKSKPMVSNTSGSSTDCKLPKICGKVTAETVMKDEIRCGDLPLIASPQFRPFRAQEQICSVDFSRLVLNLETVFKKCFVDDQLKLPPSEPTVCSRVFSKAPVSSSLRHSDVSLISSEEAFQDWRRSDFSVLTSTASISAQLQVNLALPLDFRVVPIAMASEQAASVPTEETSLAMDHTRVNGVSLALSCTSGENMTPPVVAPTSPVFTNLNVLSLSRHTLHPVASSPDLRINGSSNDRDDIRFSAFKSQLSPSQHQLPSLMPHSVNNTSSVAFEKSDRMVCGVKPRRNGPRTEEFTTPHQRHPLSTASKEGAPPSITHASFASGKRRSHLVDDRDQFANSCDLFDSDDDDDFTRAMSIALRPIQRSGGINSEVLSSKTGFSAVESSRGVVDQEVSPSPRHQSVLRTDSTPARNRPLTLLDTMPENSFIDFDSDDSFELNFAVDFGLEKILKQPSGDLVGQSLSTNPCSTASPLNDSFVHKSESYLGTLSSSAMTMKQPVSEPSSLSESASSNCTYEVEKQPRKKKPRVAEFFDTQAQVVHHRRGSRSSEEGDADDVDIEEYDEDSFVDDSSQIEFCTQNPLSSPEMKAVYLKSIKDQPHLQRISEFEMVSTTSPTPTGKNSFLESFSCNEEASDDDDGSEDDQFVVPNDFVEYETSGGESDSDMAMNAVRPKRRRLVIDDDDDSCDLEKSCDTDKGQQHVASQQFCKDNGLLPCDQSEPPASQVFRPASKSAQFAKRAAGDIPLAVVKPCFTSTSPCAVVTDDDTVLTSKLLRKPVVLINSLEIVSAQHMVSILKTEYDVETHVCSLGKCDYIISTKVAVERQLVSEFEHPFQSKRLLSRLQILLNEFDQVAVIVEKDRMKPMFYKRKKDFAEDSKEMKHTKTVDSLLVSLTLNARIKVLYADSVEDSAKLIALLAKQETARGNNITVDLDMNDKEQHMFDFFLDIPGLNYVSALYLTKKIRSPCRLLQITASEVAEIAKMKREQAEGLLRFIDRTVDAEIL